MWSRRRKNPTLPYGLAFKAFCVFSTSFTETAVSCRPIAIYKRLSCHLSYLSHVAKFHCLGETKRCYIFCVLSHIWEDWSSQSNWTSTFNESESGNKFQMQDLMENCCFFTKTASVIQTTNSHIAFLISTFCSSLCGGSGFHFSRRLFVKHHFAEPAWYNYWINLLNEAQDLCRSRRMLSASVEYSLRDH